MLWIGIAWDHYSSDSVSPTIWTRWKWIIFPFLLLSQINTWASFKRCISTDSPLPPNMNVQIGWKCKVKGEVARLDIQHCLIYSTAPSTSSRPWRASRRTSQSLTWSRSSRRSTPSCSASSDRFSWSFQTTCCPAAAANPQPELESRGRPASRATSRTTREVIRNRQAVPQAVLLKAARTASPKSDFDLTVQLFRGFKFPFNSADYSINPLILFSYRSSFLFGLEILAQVGLVSWGEAYSSHPPLGYRFCLKSLHEPLE